jgi:predicted DNA-binding transcriptional regulator AlpA
MATFEFDLVISGLDLDVHEAAIQEFETRIADMTFAERDGSVLVAVEGAAGSLADAIRSAVADVETIPGVRVERILPDGAVSQAEVAQRIGRSRQSVSQLIQGQRGPGSFPPPAFGHGRTAVWRWSEVSAWLADAGIAATGDVERQSVIDAANAMLSARRAVSNLRGDDQAQIRGMVA